MTNKFQFELDKTEIFTTENLSLIDFDYEKNLTKKSLNYQKDQLLVSMRSNDFFNDSSNITSNKENLLKINTGSNQSMIKTQYNNEDNNQNNNEHCKLDILNLSTKNDEIDICENNENIKHKLSQVHNLISYNKNLKSSENNVICINKMQEIQKGMSLKDNIKDILSYHINDFINYDQLEKNIKTKSF